MTMKSIRCMSVSNILSFFRASHRPAVHGVSSTIAKHLIQPLPNGMAANCIGGLSPHLRTLFGARNIRAYKSDVPVRGLESALTGVLDSSWAEHEFTRVAEQSLELIFETVCASGFDSDSAPDDLDADLSQGVLSINLGSGTYVLNTQTPNRQIWLSSPVSGPWRYAWHPGRGEWLSSRDGHLLSHRLSTELSDILQKPVSVNFSNVIDGSTKK